MTSGPGSANIKITIYTGAIGGAQVFTSAHSTDNVSCLQ